MCKKFQKSALPTLFHFVKVRAPFQPHVYIYIVAMKWLKISKIVNFSPSLILFSHTLYTYVGYPNVEMDQGNHPPHDDLIFYSDGNLNKTLGS